MQGADQCTAQTRSQILRSLCRELARAQELARLIFTFENLELSSLDTLKNLADWLHSARELRVFACRPLLQVIQVKHFSHSQLTLLDNFGREPLKRLSMLFVDGVHPL